MDLILNLHLNVLGNIPNVFFSKSLNQIELHLIFEPMFIHLIFEPLLFHLIFEPCLFISKQPLLASTFFETLSTCHFASICSFM